MHSSRSHVLLIGLVAALMLALLPPAAVAQDDPCGDIVTNAELEALLDARGTVDATGLTVVRGEEPQSFDVEILGILENGVGAGRDMIMVDVSADFIDDAGGIWQGMSGSPVYIGDELVGAVAYGLSFVSTSIGGLTPAEDMMDLIDLPDGEPSFASASAENRPDEIVVTGPMAAEIRSRTDGGAFASAGDSVRFRQLATPLNVSGLSPDRLEVFQRWMRSTGHEVTAYAGSSTAFDQVGSTADVPIPGGNIAAASSYGDLTSAAVGTTTLACEGKVAAFGHPFAFRGETLAGASLADAITIVPDPGFAPFKLANIGDIFGTIDQDRMAGIRGRSGDIPDTTPVTSRVADLGGRTRTGRTDVVDPNMLAELAAFSLLSNLDSTVDRFGKGSSELSLTVRGTGAESGDFRLERTNLFASQFDISFESIFESLFLISSLQQFTGEDVTIESIRYDAETQLDVLAYGIDEVRIGINGGEPVPYSPFVAELYLLPGDTVAIEVDLSGLEDDAALTETLTLLVPDDAQGFGFLEVIGGSFFGGGEDCLFFPEACQGDEGEATTIQELADELAAQPTNNTLTSRIVFDEFAEPPIPLPDDAAASEEPAPEPSPEPPPGEFDQASSDLTASALLDRVVSGGFGLPVFVEGGACQDCEPFAVRFAGGSRVETATALARDVFGATETVVIAPAGDYPYALVAGPLAASSFAPVLLNGEGGLDPANQQVIADLGASRAIIVAADGMLGIEAELAAAGITDVTRHGGADRYAVAESVARAMADLGSTSAWLVEGENADPARGWPDALAAAPVAAQQISPVLLTPQAQLPDSTGQLIADLGYASITIAGGESAVSAEVEAAAGASGATVARVAGDSRYGTSVALANLALEGGAFPGFVWIVTGDSFPDGLAAAPAVAVTGGIMLLVPSGDLNNAPEVAQFLAGLAGTGPVVGIVGGTGAVSAQVEAQVLDVLTTGAVG